MGVCAVGLGRWLDKRAERFEHQQNEQSATAFAEWIDNRGRECDSMTEINAAALKLHEMTEDFQLPYERVRLALAQLTTRSGLNLAYALVILWEKEKWPSQWGARTQDAVMGLGESWKGSRSRIFRPS